MGWSCTAEQSERIRSIQNAHNAEGFIIEGDDRYFVESPRNNRDYDDAHPVRIDVMRMFKGSDTCERIGTISIDGKGRVTIPAMLANLRRVFA